MKLYKTLIAITFLFVIINSCKDNGTGPGTEIKNPREYTWTADTVYYPGSYQTIMVSTWANNEKDIYAVGHTDVNEGQFWHYNGSKWEVIKIFDHIARGVLSFHKIWGLSSTQIWIVGNRGGFGEEVPVIWQYNGHTMHETKLEGYKGRLRSVHGTDNTNIWACGDSGLVAHYNGSKWTVKKIAYPNNKLAALWFEDIVAESNLAYIVSHGLNVINGRTKNYFFKGDINNWTISDSSEIEPYGHISKWGYRHLYMSSWKTIYSHTHGLFRFTSTGWERMTDFFSNYTPTRDLMGTSEKNMIIVGDFSKAYHWNGSDVFEFKNLEKENISSFNSVEIFNDQAFVFGHTVSFPQKTIIYHGK